MAGLSRFQWDAGNLAKCQRHGVSIDEIEALFISGPRVARDEAHSEAEDRYVAVGRNRSGRPLFVIFTLRIEGDRQLVRPVSARYMHAREVRRYEQEDPKTED